MARPNTSIVKACLVGAALPILLSACAEWPRPASRPAAEAPDQCESTASPADNTRLASIEQLVKDGKFYAALAQLDALGISTPQARLTRAEALRRIDRDKEAAAIYAQLVGSCLDGRAHHGLGLLSAKAGDTAASLSHLKIARQALPTDASVRNDLGYALLLDGQWPEAQFEFLTVLDLSPKDPKASHNLVLLTFLQKQDAKAFELASKLGLDATTANALHQQAQARLAMMPGPSSTSPLR
jgi:Flp pilus assembly protein TadD